MNLTKVKYGNISISTYTLMVYFILMPLDSYFAEVSSFFNVNYILIAYMILRAVDIIFCGKPICFYKKPAFLLYPFYMAILSLINVLNERSYNSLLFLFMMVAFLFMISKKYTKSEIKLIYASAIVSFLLFLIVLCVNTVKLNNGLYVRIVDIIDPNYLITSMVFLTSVMTYYWIKEKNICKNLILLFCLGALFVFAFIIGTRGGLLACLMSFIVTSLFMNKHPIRILLIIIIAMAALLLIVSPFIPESILKRFTLQNMISGGGSGRITIWKNYLWFYKIGGWKVWLFGYGKDIVPNLYLAEFGKTYYPHNLYIKALADGGIVGLFLLIWLCIGCIQKCFKDKNAINLGAWLGFMIGAMFLDMDNVRIFWFLLFVIYMKSRDDKILSWRGRNGFLGSGADLQCC